MTYIGVFCGIKLDWLHSRKVVARRWSQVESYIRECISATVAITTIAGVFAILTICYNP